MAETKQKAIVYDMPGLIEIDVCAHKKVRDRGGRGISWQPTSKAQERVNINRRKREVQRIVNINFDGDGIMLELDYAQEHYTDDMAEARRDMQNYIRRIKRLYKKADATLKYIYTTERGEESGRVHHHMIVTGGVDKEALLAAWKKSKRCFAKKLEFSENGYADLAAYYAKRHEAFERCFTCSQNIERPEPLPEEDKTARRISRVFTKKVCADFYEHNFTRAEVAALFPGFKVCDGWTCTYNPYDHTYYMHMRLLKSGANVASWATTVTYNSGTMGDAYPWADLRPEENTRRWRDTEDYYNSAYERAISDGEDD